MSENYTDIITKNCEIKDRCSNFKKIVENWQKQAQNIYDYSYDIGQGVIANYESSAKNVLGEKALSLFEDITNLYNSINTLHKNVEDQISALSESISYYQKLAADEAQHQE